MNETTPENDLITVDEVALELGTTPLNVLLYIKRGQLAGQEIEGRWYVEKASLAALQSTGDKVGSAPCTPACKHGGGCGSCH